MADGSTKKGAARLKMDSTFYLIRHTFRGFTAALERRLERHGITISVWCFLRLLWENDGLSQKELSDELGLTQPTTVAAMDNMEELGLIERRRNTEDRRKVNIFLTKKGRALKETLLPYASEVNKLAVKNVSAEELKLLWDIHERINSALERDSVAFVSSQKAARA